MSFPFSISCCSIALREHPVAAAIDLIAAAGFGGIEFWFPHLENLDHAGLLNVSDQCARKQLTPLVISPYFSFTRGEEWKLKSLDTARQALKIAKVLEVGKIRTFVDIGPDGLPSHRATPTHWHAAREGLRELCALDPNSLFVVETHVNTLADTLPSVQRLLEEVDRPNLRLNFQANPDFLQRGYRESLEALFPYIHHLHWQQHRADGTETYLEEAGLINFQAVIEWLLSKNYRGTASVEYCWQPVDENRIGTAACFLSGIAKDHALAAARTGP